MTITVIEWINIFTKPEYFEILRNSFQHCVDTFGLQLYEYVFVGAPVFGAWRRHWSPERQVVNWGD